MQRRMQLLCLSLCGWPLLSQTAPGSTFAEAGRYSEITSDFRARRVGDVVTIVVSDRLSASTQGGSASSRKSAASAKIPAIFGNRALVGALNNLADLQGNSKLDGSGSTSRSNVLTTTLSGRVIEVLPNGDLMIQADKELVVNSERQQIGIRGLVRWNDISNTNLVQSNKISQISIQLNGKGIVSDAIRRPNVLYRFLSALLPF